jgi:hypothetical protein
MREFEFEVGDRVLVSVEWRREGKHGTGVILRDDGGWWRIKLDKFKRPKFISKSFCYPPPKHTRRAS